MAIKIMQDSFTLLLRVMAETIYRSESHSPLLALLKGAAGEEEGRGKHYLCLVAAKVFYFGVGGGVEEFAARVKDEGGTVNNVWELLDRPELDITFRRHLVVASQRLAKRSNLYPACYELKNIVQEGQFPLEAGGFADIYKGRFEGQPVCLKAIRVYQSTRVEYLIKAINVAEGLQYLHENGVVHGDLKGPNILIDNAGRARLADFGLSSVSDPQILAWTSTSSAASKGGSVRWQAPELFDIDNDAVVKNTPESDVYAWSCVAFEIFTNTVPFADLQRESTIELRVMSGTRPTRPLDHSPPWREWGLTSSIWSLIQECWEKAPSDRPKVPQVIARMSTQLDHNAQLHRQSNDLDPARFRRVQNHVVDMRDASTHIDRILNRGPLVPVMCIDQATIPPDKNIEEDQLAHTTIDVTGPIAHSEHSQYITLPPPPLQLPLHRNPVDLAALSRFDRRWPQRPITNFSDQAYEEFLSMVWMYDNGGFGTTEVVQHIAQLYREYPDLLQVIKPFLPNGYHIDDSRGAAMIVLTTPHGRKMGIGFWSAKHKMITNASLCGIVLLILACSSTPQDKHIPTSDLYRQFLAMAVKFMRMLLSKFRKTSATKEHTKEHQFIESTRGQCDTVQAAGTIRHLVADETQSALIQSRQCPSSVHAIDHGVVPKPSPPCSDPVEEMLMMLQGLPGKVKKVSNEVGRLREDLQSAESRNRSLSKCLPAPAIEEQTVIITPAEEQTSMSELPLPDAPPTHYTASKSRALNAASLTPHLNTGAFSTWAARFGRLVNVQHWRTQRTP
ncbi:hypothetical protein DXG01_012023 [Tephrocybe rancida]|nr:hypothetical protein DXG01_012023 [Tephrocybe rancida]